MTPSSVTAVECADPADTVVMTRVEYGCTDNVVFSCNTASNMYVECNCQRNGTYGKNAMKLVTNSEDEHSEREKTVQDDRKLKKRDKAGHEQRRWAQRAGENSAG